jgi:superfamily II DNA/RNA helicase
MSFDSLGLSPALVRAATERGYEQPTSIQTVAIPAVLRGVDVLARAQTGSGKTAAFALPLLQQLEADLRPPHSRAARHTHALVLVPTRELAMQVGETFRALAQNTWRSVRVATVFGGVSINPQMMALRGGAEIVVATPGRLLDLVDHNALRLDRLAVLVLDEADRLLDAGFADELQRILALLPARRQGLLFSATLPPAVQALADGLLRSPVQVEGAAGPVAKITQRVLQVDAPRRTMLLRQLIRDEGWTRVLVFVASRYATEHVAGKLAGHGIAAGALHGDLSQGARTQVLADFKAGALQVLVATDVAARGLDIARLPVVVNYDLPRAAADYVHRIGRTGRAGAEGLAVSFVSADTEAHFRLIEKRQDQRVPREQVPGFEPVEAATPVPAGADPNGGIKGRRKSKKDKLREAAARGE